MKLTYHQAALDLIPEKPPFSRSASLQLDQREQELGIKFPASLREWYSLDGAVELLARYSNQDHPVSLPQLGIDDESTRQLLRKDNLLYFMYENQGVAHWVIRLDGNDDPKVLVAIDGWKKPVWVRGAESYSDFIYSWLFDFSRRWGKATCGKNYDTGGSIKTNPGNLKYLEESFHCGPRTYGWPGEINYRFYRDNVRLTINFNEGYADWYLWVENDLVFGNLKQEFVRCGELGKILLELIPEPSYIFDRIK